jgi:hypothetical protein
VIGQARRLSKGNTFLLVVQQTVAVRGTYVLAGGGGDAMCEVMLRPFGRNGVRGTKDT